MGVVRTKSANGEACQHGETEKSRKTSPKSKGIEIVAHQMMSPETAGVFVQFNVCQFFCYHNGFRN